MRDFFRLTAVRARVGGVLLAITVIAACGRQAPTFAPGDLTVTSSPDGAAIFIDGQDTGEQTPHTFVGLDPDFYVVSVQLPDYVATPGNVPVDLAPLDDLTIDFSLSRTGIFVTSAPEGAQIIVDGIDTGLVTPATVAGLTPGTAVVSLRLDTYIVTPGEATITVIEDSVRTLDPGTFVMRPQRTVLLEGFANSNCIPCPQLTGNLLSMAARPEFTPDRVLYIEYSVNWPNPVDPLYQFNAPENTDRFTEYRVLGAPALFADGRQLDDALDFAEMEAAILADLAVDPGFRLDVTADFSNPVVPVGVQLVADTSRDLTGHSLYVALYEREIDFDERDLPVGTNGQVIYHHVFRDRANDLIALGQLAADTGQVHEVTLARGDWPLDNLVVVALVQRDSDFAIIQAGSFGEAAATGSSPR